MRLLVVIPNLRKRGEMKCQSFLAWIKSVNQDNMPATKNALLRYQILDRCFSNRYRKYTFDNLLDEVNESLIELNGKGVSPRQLKDDIRIMRDSAGYNAPIETYPYEGKKCYYRYSDQSFSIFKRELSIQDLNNLRSTIDMLWRYRSNPANVWLEEVISNLEYRLGIKADSENVISFDRNDRLQGIENLSAIIEATVNHQPLRITYQNYKGKEQTNVLHPYYIKEYNGRWFLFGYNETYKNISNYALDRIKEFRHEDVPFIKNARINFEDYFNDIVGVTIPNEATALETIVLRFSQDRYPYVLSKPIHQSQKIIDEQQHEISITVRPNRELRQQIYSFLPDVEIVSPQWLRNEIMQNLEENLKKYLSVQKSRTENM